MVWRKVPWILFVLCGILLLAEAYGRSQDPDPRVDFRIITYSDLLDDEKVFRFTDPNIEDYMQLTVDIPRQQLLVGARNYLLRLDLGDLTDLETVEWVPTKLNQSICKAKGQPQSYCQNYIRVLILHKNQVFACGTNAFSPACSWRESKKLSSVTQWVSGLGKCPYSPKYNNTAMMTDDGNYYSGTVMDFTARDPAIYRIMGPSPHLRTVQFNSKWLNDPDFISSHEIGNSIYFFFRETAVEYINCGKTVYSRVARICKGDMGGHFLLEDNWTTFMKARLNCSMPGKFPFYFHDLQATHYDAEFGVVYGIFTTSPTGVYASAVCVFKLSAFEAVFGGPFKYQENSKMAWERVTNNGPPPQCPSTSSNKRSLAPTMPKHSNLVNAQKFQMMDHAVQPAEVHPLIVAEGDRWTHIVVDHVEAKHHEDLSIVFVATMEGKIKKLVRPPHMKSTCVVEEVSLVPPGEQEQILSMQLMHDQGVLFVSTRSQVLRIPVQRCHRFHSKQECMNSQDPYCGWHSKLHQCTTVPSSKPYHNWHQNITSCPIMQNPVDGDWSEWSDWSECHHIGSSRDGDKCICRYRGCDDPKPQHGGQPCLGQSVEVTNCTTHGGWTNWSDWSSCSASCGVALRSRRRTCSNPEPKFDGRVCVGPAMDEEYCLELPECPTPTPEPIDGGWSHWREWSTCSSRCGGGIQEKYRICDNPAPAYGGQGCIGNHQEWQLCNNDDCAELRKASDWTQWFKFNSSREGHIEQRFRFVCKANVPDIRYLRVTSMKTDSRFCPTNSDECTQTASAACDTDGGWSGWSPWTRCDKVCGSGIQFRERLCDDPLPCGNGKNCPGHGREERECNIHSCQGIWSAWTEYGACSVTCGQGIEWRTRQCQAQAPDKQYTRPCYGNDRDEDICKMPPCSRYDGWEEWTLWSVCAVENTQVRKRRCRLPFPSPEQCTGPEKEKRMCRFNVIAAKTEEVSQKKATQRDNFQIFHLVIVGLIGFLLGGVVCVGIFLYCQRWRKAARQDKYSQYHEDTYGKNDVKPNLYMSPSQVSGISQSEPLNNKYNYSSGSLGRNSKDPSKMTVKEATLKRNSLMRTNLSLNDL